MLNQQTIHKLLRHAAERHGRCLPPATRAARSWAASALKNASACWWTGNGTGKRTAHWRAACATQASDHRLRWKTSTTKRRAGWIAPLMRSLAPESEWVKQHQNIFLIGATGLGKSWLAAALAHKACRDGYTVYYARAAQLFRELALAHADGSFSRFLRRLALTDVLVIDDLGHGAAHRSRTPRLPGDLRRPLSDPLHRPDLAGPGGSTGTRRSAIQRPPTASSTAWFITPTASNSQANPCARTAAERRRYERSHFHG